MNFCNHLIKVMEGRVTPHQRQGSGSSNLVHTSYFSSVTPVVSLEGQAIAAQTLGGCMEVPLTVKIYRTFGSVLSQW